MANKQNVSKNEEMSRRFEKRDINAEALRNTKKEGIQE